MRRAQTAIAINNTSRNRFYAIRRHICKNFIKWRNSSGSYYCDAWWTFFLVFAYEKRLMMLKIESLSVKLGSSEVLRDVTIEAKKGDFIALLGPNGSGKSTLLRSIFGVVKPLKGIVFSMEKNMKWDICHKIVPIQT